MLKWFRKSKPVHSEPVTPPQREDFASAHKVLERFSVETGISFAHKESITTEKLIRFCRLHGIVSFDELLSRYDRDPIIHEALINLLTVNETYFFREAGQIEFMASHVDPMKSVRVLTAPGSSGEEPYSIAIALLEASVPAHRIEIISIDINTEMTELAKSGLYSTRSLHKTPASIQSRYFEPRENQFALRPEVKTCVRFENINIFDDSLLRLGTFDFIFSRNMLIYFEKDQAEKAMERLCRLSTSSTMMFFGHADVASTPPFLLGHYAHGIKYYTPNTP